MRGELELVQHAGKRLALIIHDANTDERVKFFTDSADALQVGAFSIPRGHEIAPHVHQNCSRTIDQTTEVLVLQAGRMRVDFYACENVYLQSCEIAAGDVIVLFDGGHGFTMLEDVRMLEIKQGPYAGDLDKKRFVRPPGIPTSA